MKYDFIVVGAGSAGCAVAARLSESGQYTVLLLEAGGPDDNPDIHIPAHFSNLFHTDDDWDYETVPQVGLNNRKEYVPRGKVYGGTSSMNAMVYQRGHPADYDQWAEMGNEGWSYADVLPYFKKMQHQPRGASEHHGVDGPVHTSDPRDPNPLSLAFVEAAQQAGYAHNDDFNDGEQEGFGLYQTTQKNGERHSTAVAYLHPALDRDNFTAIPYAHVTKLLLDETRCIGVAYYHEGEVKTAHVNHEVILCGGALNSPQLLMLSGIGSADHLAELGIPVVKDLAGVGQNLMDHMQVPVAFHCTQPVSLVAKDDLVQRQSYKDNRMGLLTSNLGEAGGFIKLHSQSRSPELQFHFGPDWFIRHGFESPTGHGFTVLAGLVGTKSIGELKLQSNDPLAPPLIDFACLTDEADVQVLLEGVKIARRIVATPAFDDYRGDEFLPGADVQSDEDLIDYIRNFATTIYHPVGTCKMGHDQRAVVNDRLQVHGIEGLRVADASIMPFIVNANTNAPCIMIGEKVADLILGDYL